MTVYDDPINAARRLLTIHKDMSWAQKELVELMPLVLDAYDKLDDRYEDGYHDAEQEHYRRERELEEEIDDLTYEIEILRAKLNEGS